jgi:organic radical activating enzyme
MTVQCLSVVVGTKACNARCPFCVSRQTGFDQASRGRKRRINYINLEEACTICGTARPPSLLMTGKGEPTLYPNEITEYLEWFSDRPFAPKELQTNGLVTTSWDHASAALLLQGDSNYG